MPVLEVINELAKAKGKTANVCFRINPEVGAHTHANITTGLAENKFGIAMSDMVPVRERALSLENINFTGLHFHIGSQIRHMHAYEQLCLRINALQDVLASKGSMVENLNVGGGLGINYYDPEKDPVPDFKSYFKTFANGLRLRPGQ